MRNAIGNYLNLYKSDEFYLKERKGIVKQLLKEARQKYSVNIISKYAKKSQRAIYYYFTNKRTPSILFSHKLADLIGKDHSKHFFESFEEIGTWGHKGHKLPKTCCKELAYLSGIICGDGHISHTR